MTSPRIAGLALLVAATITFVGATFNDAGTEEPVEAAEAVATESAVYEGPIPTVTSLGQFKITHYCACEKCCGKWALNRPDGIVYTASGAPAKANHTIAVDTSIIPFGTEVVVRYDNGDEAVYVAEDTGAAVIGKHIDVYMDDHDGAWSAGVRYGEVVTIDYGETTYE